MNIIYFEYYIIYILKFLLLILICYSDAIHTDSKMFIQNEFEEVRLRVGVNPDGQNSNLNHQLEPSKMKRVEWDQTCLIWRLFGITLFWLTINDSKSVCESRVFFYDISSDNQSLNFWCPFINLSDSSVAVMSLCRHIRDKPHSTKHLNGLMSNPRCSFRCNQLCHCSMFCVWLNFFQSYKSPTINHTKWIIWYRGWPH